MSENYCANINAQEVGADFPHVARYLLARGFVNKNDLVLDSACGYGYGSYLISQNAKGVVGVDHREDCIDFAKANYASKKTSFNQIDLEKEASKLPEVDVTISIETIEHLENPQDFLDNLTVKTRKTIIISSPDKETAAIHEFHKQDVTLSACRNLMSKYPDWREYHSFIQGYSYIIIFVKEIEWLK